ncbi:exo-beta-1,3-glucanase [Coprinopsis cinerea AmutBmut pab1-1]|nr:exo-beta-1,3-glucanase [Coprinopsis cinerea AmutBmut pab1-1]
MAINIPAPTRLLTLSARAPSSPPDSPDLNPRPDSTCVPWIPDPAKSHALKPTYSITSSTINTQDHSKRGSLNLESHMWATCNDDKPLYSSDSGPSLSSGKRSARCGRITLVIIGVASVILLGVFLPLHFGVLRSLHHGNTVPLSRGNETNSQPTTHTLLRGGDGSEVTTADGTKFTYRNPFGGFWISDPEDPFNLDAQPNEWTPPLNRSWRWGQDRIFGVNLGGLFVLEPFITPGVFEARPGSVDEYTLSEMMRDGVNGTQGFQDLEEHYKTFITEKDIAEIAGAGLNWLRVPLGFWAVEVYENEPFLERTSWTYFLRIVEWARKYGLRIYLDLHAVPGGQNGMNHSGRVHRISFLAGNMGLANAQRTLYYLRVLTEFISQPQYSSVIPVLGILNEPLSEELGMEALSSFYLEAYTMIRNITGYGEGNGPYIAIGDGLRSPLDWEGLLPNADRVIMDAHPYVAFDRSHDTSPLTDLAEDGEFGGIWPRTACQRWGPLINSTKMALGVTIGGEFSGALNDCGRYIREVGVTSDHPQCRLYDDWENWTDELKAGLQNFILASMDAIGDFFFWTWKVRLCLVAP